jgi:hypothetical protein
MAIGVVGGLDVEEEAFDGDVLEVVGVFARGCLNSLIGRLDGVVS